MFRAAIAAVLTHRSWRQAEQSKCFLSNLLHLGLLRKWPIFNFLFYFIFITVPYPLPQFLLLFPPCLWEGVPLSSPTPFPETSNLSKIKDISHWGQSRQTSAILLPGTLDHPVYAPSWWLNLWELCGVQVIWVENVHLSMGSLSLSSSSILPWLNQGAPDFSSMVGYKYLHLSLMCNKNDTHYYLQSFESCIYLTIF